MAPFKDHYRVLGVPRDASSERIRRAFRRLAKECHPDCAGPDESGRFREIAEAHEVLSDPERRREHDVSLAREEHGPRRERAEAGRPASRAAPAEPLRPSDPSGGGWGEPSWGDWRGEPLRPSDPSGGGWDEPSWGRPRGEPLWSSDLRGGGWGEPLQGRPRAEPLIPGARSRARSSVAAPARGARDGLEVILTPDEAARGGRVPLLLSSRQRCPTCHGAGGFFWSGVPCPQCHGAGVVLRRHELDLELPAGLRDGDRFEARLAPAGLEASSIPLTLTVRVRAWG